MKPQLTLRDLFWLLLAVGLAHTGHADELDDRSWLKLLLKCDSANIVEAEPTNNRHLKGKTFSERGDLTRIVKLLVAAERFRRLEDGERATIVSPVVVHLVLESSDGTQLKTTVHGGGLLISDGMHTTVASLKRAKAAELLTVLGAKEPGAQD